MTVVSDAGPILYLVLTDYVWLLPELYGEIWIPPVVADELRHPSAPPLVSNFLSQELPWLITKGPSDVSVDLELDRGETEAISLAAEYRATILTDDLRAVVKARALGLTAFGTLGVFQQAYIRSLVDIETALAKLAGTNFRHTAALFEKVVAETKLRKEGS